jgi:hypothetical protein
LEFLAPNYTFSFIEIFDLSGGASAGVSVSIDASFANNFTTIKGDGTTDILNFFESNFRLDSGATLSGIETITTTEVDASQTLTFISGATISGLTSILGTPDANGVDDDIINIRGDFDFSGVTLSNIEELRIEDGQSSRQTLGADSSSSFGLTEIVEFETGSASTTDVFDYKSDLVAGDGTVVSSSSSFTLTTIDSAARATNIISANSTGIIEFETTNVTNLTFDITSSSLSQITSAVESLLESTNASTNLTGTSGGVTQGAVNTDSLLVFYDTDDDAVVIRYQEGSTSEADYNGELSVVAIFETLVGDTFNDANIV